MKKTAQPHAYSDMVFKFLLGREESKEQLIAFVNAVLPHGGHSNITELDIQNPFSIQEFQKDKLSILDLKAKDETGRSFNLEVQSNGYQDFAYRSLYYWSKIYSSQIKEGEDYLELKPVISINLLNFILIKETSKYHNIFRLKEQDNPEITLGNHLLINYLEMPKLDIRGKRNTLENWLIFFLYEGKEDGVSKSNQIIEEIISRDENIAKVHEDYKKFMADEKLHGLALSREIAQLDQNTRLKRARMEGLEQGIEKGRQEGKTVEKEDAARNAFNLGLDIETVQMITGLSMDDLEKLRKG